MVIRARLVAPPPKQKTSWPHHEPSWTIIKLSQMASGERRMEADTYLSHGFGVKEAIQAKSSGWILFGDLANVYQPGRLKGVLVSPDYGTPFLTATQAFDIRPVPRKFLALQKMKTAKDCFVTEGTILLTRSGSVGRPMLAHAPHIGVVLSDDLLRVTAKQDNYHGWIYAYLLSPQVRAMSTGAQYGHMIKHLETFHLEALPTLLVDEATQKDFNDRASAIISHRNQGYSYTIEAEKLFEKAVGAFKPSDWGENGFVVNAFPSILNKRRRLEASYHNPGSASIRRHISTRGQGMTSIREMGYSVRVPGRYKRIPAKNGVIYRDSADILEISPDLTKRFADCDFGDEYGGRVKDGWILVPCSGQVYGIIGSAILATKALDDQVVSNHVIRLVPTEQSAVRAGYLLTALSHPTLGRPILKSLPFGSSVPEIDPDELSSLEIVRLTPERESAIADLAERAAQERATADILEQRAARDAGLIIEEFISHK